MALAVQATETSFDAGILREDIKAERLYGDLLEVDKSALTTPSRIEAIAGSTMRMADAADVDYLALPDGVVGDTASPAQEADGSVDLYIRSGAALNHPHTTATPFDGTWHHILFVQDGATATVTYTMNSPYYMTESHLYVGNDVLATDNGAFTVAPGQYLQIHDPVASGSSDSYTVSGLSGGIYVVAHATVFGF